MNLKNLPRANSRSTRLTQATTLPEIKADFEKLCVDLGRVVTYAGKQLSPGHVVNALVLELVEGMGWDDQVRHVASGIRRLEAHNHMAEPAPGPSRNAGTEVVDVPAPKLPARKPKKRG